jgi:hypothetical protein
VNRRRHILAFIYVIMGLVVAVTGRAYLGLDSAQTYGYSIATYVVLMLLNYRTMLTRVPAGAPEAPRDRRP